MVFILYQHYVSHVSQLINDEIYAKTHANFTFVNFRIKKPSKIISNNKCINIIFFIILTGSLFDVINIVEVYDDHLIPHSSAGQLTDGASTHLTDFERCLEVARVC